MDRGIVVQNKAVNSCGCEVDFTTKIAPDICVVSKKKAVLSQHRPYKYIINIELVTMLSALYVRIPIVNKVLQICIVLRGFVFCARTRIEHES